MSADAKNQPSALIEEQIEMVIHVLGFVLLYAEKIRPSSMVARQQMDVYIQKHVKVRVILFKTNKLLHREMVDILVEVCRVSLVRRNILQKEELQLGFLSLRGRKSVPSHQSSPEQETYCSFIFQISSNFKSKIHFA